MLRRACCLGLLVLSFLAIGDEMLQSYILGNYPRAEKLARELKNDPEGRLILQLSKVYDKTNSENTTLEGIYALGDYYRDEKMPAKYRLLAGMSYARCGQLAQERKDIYGNAADNVDYKSVYADIIKRYPNSAEACAAVLYLRPKPDEIDRFIRKFKGNRKDLVPLYLYLAYVYTEDENRDYRKAIQALQDASKIGITHPSIHQNVLFRIGYLYDKKLNDFDHAEKYYREYLKLYPLSRNSRIIGRYLQEKGK